MESNTWQKSIILDRSSASLTSGANFLQCQLHKYQDEKRDRGSSRGTAGKSYNPDGITLSGPGAAGGRPGI
jgi:hypothetical protein